MTDFKNIIKYVVIGLIAIVGISIFFSSQEEVKQGDEGFVYAPYNGGVIKDKTYVEGTHFIAPWNEMVSYNVRQQSKQYRADVMDKNGTNVTIVVSVNFSASKGKTPQLHLKHGPGYIQFIDDKVKGAIKDVVGRYTYEEVYSTKREALEGEIETILTNDFKGNFVDLAYVEIADVDLPGPIAAEITNKESQKQRNLKSELMKTEEKNLADARIEKARGDSSLLVSAVFKAKAIQKEAEQLNKNPQYIEYIKWKGFADNKVSPYGTNNVFGVSSGVMISK